MQMKFSKSVAAGSVGMFVATIASAHPGHAPTDLAAEVSQPLAGLDHFVAFIALTSCLLLLLRAILKHQAAQQQKARK